MKHIEDFLKIALAEVRLGHGDAAASWVANALEALAAERAAKRSAALDALALNDAPLISEPRSYSHWGMH